MLFQRARQGLMRCLSLWAFEWGADASNNSTCLKMRLGFSKRDAVLWRFLLREGISIQQYYYIQSNNYTKANPRKGVHFERDTLKRYIWYHWSTRWLPWAQESMAWSHLPGKRQAASLIPICRASKVNSHLAGQWRAQVIYLMTKSVKSVKFL